ncbi:MAG: 30S ribosomal protein S21 [Patescibacteria group bacterium]|nr:30S ribosomal protein S21 [Patescibacteria group bacterium]
MAEFKRKKGESFEGFLRRFNKALKQSGRLYVARQKQHREPKKNKRQQKEYALTSLRLRKEKEYLRKTGKLVEDNFKRKR